MCCATATHAECFHKSHVCLGDKLYISLLIISPRLVQEIFDVTAQKFLCSIVLILNIALKRTALVWQMCVSALNVLYARLLVRMQGF